MSGSSTIDLLRGPLAQLVEQRTFNPWVVGSSPTGPTVSWRVTSPKINVLGEKIEPDAGALRGGHALAADSPPALERALVVGEVRRESEIGCSISVVPTAAVVAHPLRVEVTLRGLPGVIGRAVRHLGRRRQGHSRVSIRQQFPDERLCVLVAAPAIADVPDLALCVLRYSAGQG